MGEIVNLRQFRKKSARTAKEREAEQNRILFGRTKAEKDFARNEARKAEQFLASNRLEPTGKSDADPDEGPDQDK